MTWVAGVDGFKRQWFVVLRRSHDGAIRTRIVDAFAELLSLPEQPAVVAVDIPIGLPEITLPGGRACDREARRALGSQSRSVFSPVGRAALAATTRAEADRINREGGGIGIGAQAWGLAHKLREADRAITPTGQSALYEAHPELSFRTMQDGRSLVGGKKSEAGLLARVDLLTQAGFPRDALQATLAQRRSGRDDFLDACAAAWTAGRIANGAAGRFPREPERDARGLDMAIWF